MPIEPLVERYTEWWLDYIPEKLKSNFEIEVIEGEKLTYKVETGTVLDAAGTNFYKTVQLRKICQKFYNKEIAPNSVFLICDIWFPGIEMIRYMANMYNIPVFIYGVWHAGSITMNDFAQKMHSWSKDFEVGFLNMCDGVFVGSEYSKQSIVNRLLYDMSEETASRIEKKIICCGMPLDFLSLQQYVTEEKENIVVFPHRPDPEKNPEVFVQLVDNLSITLNDFDKYKFIFCTSREKYQSSSAFIQLGIVNLKNRYPNVEILENLSKAEYYSLLGKSKLMVSTTSEENFGYCVVEAMALGCPVILPNMFSHPELVENDVNYLYDDYNELMDKSIALLESDYNHSKVVQYYAKPYDSTIYEWGKIMYRGIL
jgi:glycosyltransferase involved in cell wall biosynthesis